MRIYFVVLSALVILAPAMPQASKWTPQPQVTDRLKAAQAGSTPAQDASNSARDEALKQLAGNGLSQGTAGQFQQPRPPLLQPPQVSPWTGPFSNMGPYGNGLDLGIRRRDLVGMLPSPPKSCSIPLLEVPVDGNYDQGIRLPHSRRSGSSGDPKMAVPPPAPVCENQPAPGPRLKAK
ncbi:MAG: hypothetical protein WBW33_33690 [Bryobacteraceae bacterium]